MTGAPGGGRRLLIVEDEAVIAMLLEDEAARAGFHVLPVESTVAGALGAVERNAPEIAILDMHLAGEPAYPVADALAARDAPFVFISGREDTTPPRHRDVQCVMKPFVFDDVMAALETALHTER